MIPSNEQITTLLTAPGRPFEIEACTIRGVPLRCWKNAPPTLRHVLDASRRFADRPYIVYESEQLTFAEHYRCVAALANRLTSEFRIRKGDRVAIAMRNFPEWSIAFWATVAVGAIAVPLNAWWTAGELEYALEDCGARLVFLDKERADRLAGSLPRFDLAGAIIARDEQVSAPFTSLTDLLDRRDGARELPSVALQPDDDATILYTSGTTGRPEGRTRHTPQRLPRSLRASHFSARGRCCGSGASLESLASCRMRSQCPC
jgi:long-chain acyl-CoA synthetase